MVAAGEDMEGGMQGRGCASGDAGHRCRPMCEQCDTGPKQMPQHVAMPATYPPGQGPKGPRFATFYDLEKQPRKASPEPGAVFEKEDSVFPQMSYRVIRIH